MRAIRSMGPRLADESQPPRCLAFFPDGQVLAALWVVLRWGGAETEGRAFCVTYPGFRLSSPTMLPDRLRDPGRSLLAREAIGIDFCLMGIGAHSLAPSSTADLSALADPDHAGTRGSAGRDRRPGRAVR